ncbi:MAG: VWA domain-containing protein [Myxococcota bacterium]|nr:VWA domain-containing protein [Myxococcota bacterium]
MSLTLLLPAGLFALAVVPASLLADRRRVWVGSRRNGMAVRAGALALLGFAASQPAWQPLDPRSQTVVVVDRSQSAQAEIPGPVPGAGLVLVGAGARVAAAPGQPWPDDPGPPQVGGSDLSAGVALALSLVPPGVRPDIVLLTDGLSTDGGPASLRAALAARGARLEIVPQAVHGTGPRIVNATPQPPRIAAGGSTVVRVEVRGGENGLETPLTLRLGVDELATQPVSVGPGERVAVEVPVSVPAAASPGVHPLELSWGDDAATVGLEVEPRRRALVVGGSRMDGAALARAIEADGFSVERHAAVDAPDSLETIDVVVLADAPVGGPARVDRAGLSPGFLAALGPWVRAGGGLLVLGGPHTHDLGGYGGSLLDPLLPVRAAPPGQERDLRVELVIALDKSASMAAPVAAGAVVSGMRARMLGGNAEGSKIRLVSAAAAAALGQLRDQDQFAVLAVDSEARWALPPTPGTERDDAARRLGRLKAGGGGIFLVEALRAAQVVLQRSDAPVRHLILFADTADIGQKEDDAPSGTRTAAALVEEMAASGVTLSVIGVGARGDRDRAYLEGLARAGGGRFRLTSDFRRLRALFIAEAEQVVARSLEEEEGRRVRPVASHRGLEGTSLRGLPPLSGINRIEARADTRTLWTTDRGEPLLVSWKVGLGEVVAFGADSGEGWARAWPRWSGYGRLWTGLARALARPDTAGRGIEVVGTEVRLRNQDAAGLARPERPAKLMLARAGAEESLALAPAGPGAWTAQLPVGEGEAYTLRALDRDGLVLARAEGRLPLSPERGAGAADLDAWQTLASETRNAAPEPGRRRVPLGPWLLGAALLLLPLDALWRRGARRS